MLNPELLQRGLATLNAIDGAQGEAVMTALADIAPRPRPIHHRLRLRRDLQPSGA